MYKKTGTVHIRNLYVSGDIIFFQPNLRFSSETHMKSLVLLNLALLQRQESCQERCYRNTYRYIGVTGGPLGIGGGEDSVDKDEGADNLCTQGRAFGVAVGDLVSPTSQTVVGMMHESLHQPNPADGSKALSHHVEDRS